LAGALGICRTGAHETANRMIKNAKTHLIGIKY
jgi:hypothetical protein